MCDLYIIYRKSTRFSPCAYFFILLKFCLIIPPSMPTALPPPLLREAYRLQTPRLPCKGSCHEVTEGLAGGKLPSLRGQQNTVIQLYQKRAPGGCSFVLYNYTYSSVPSVGSAGGAWFHTGGSAEGVWFHTGGCWVGCCPSAVGAPGAWGCSGGFVPCWVPP